MPLRITYLMDYVSEPSNAKVASAHKGGWSESLWQSGDTPNPTLYAGISQLRRAMMTSGTRIIGYRQQLFSQRNGVFVAGGSSVVLLGDAGNSTYVQDVPQMALSCVAITGTGTNTRRFTLRGIPDSQVVGGEFLGSPGFVNAFRTWALSVKSFPFGFKGRDLTIGGTDINSIANGAVTLASGGGLAVNDWVIFRKVRDNDNNPVSGKFRILSIAGNVMTLNGLDATITAGPGGTLTKYEEAIFPISDINFGRVVVRKVGRPFEQYRGRRSKRR